MCGSITPGIIAHSELEFRKKLRLIEHVAPVVHLDVMDGQFVENRTWADSCVVARLRTPARFDVHCMVHDAAAAVAQWITVTRVNRVDVHVEATRDIARLAALAHDAGKQLGLAVNPATPFRATLSLLPKVDAALIMANVPGKHGRPFRPETLRRIAAIRRRFPHLPIGVDIGVNIETAPRIRAAGATFAIAGSSVFSQPDPVAAYRALVRTFR